MRVTLWDERADLATEFDVGESVEVVDGYVRERDGDLELHVGNRGGVEAIDEDIEYVPETDPIAGLEIGQTVDVAGGVIELDEKRTFDRDDGSQGQVRNVRIKDETGDIRVALWGDKADADIDLGQYAVFTDVQVKDGWQDELECSANWRSTVSVLDERPDDAPTHEAPAGAATAETASGAQGQGSLASFDASDASADGSPSASDASAETTTTETDDAGADPAEIEFTGTVVQAGSPVVLDDGTETYSVDTDASLRLGEEVTVRGRVRDGRIDAEDVF